MDIGVIGINHKSAGIRLREELARACRRLFNPGLSFHPGISFVLLSTCNRTEVYFHAPHLSDTHTYFLSCLRAEIDEEFEPYLYAYFGSDCFLHLARVTAGLDSALVGETEIQGQVKRAYEEAKLFLPLSAQLHFLFQKCLKVGKDVRSRFALLHAHSSLEEAIWHVGEHLFEDFTQKRLLFVGVSEINQKILHHLHRKKVRRLTLCNRTLSKAQILADHLKIEALPWEQLSLWHTFDCIIFGTKAPNYLIRGEGAQGSTHSRLIIDLSVPRNVDPKVGRQENVKLLNVDQLNRLIERKRRVKVEELKNIESRDLASAVTRQLHLFKLKQLQSFQGVSVAS